MLPYPRRRMWWRSGGRRRVPRLRLGFVAICFRVKMVSFVARVVGGSSLTAGGFSRRVRSVFRGLRLGHELGRPGVGILIQHCLKLGSGFGFIALQVGCF